MFAGYKMVIFESDCEVGEVNISRLIFFSFYKFSSHYRFQQEYKYSPTNHVYCFTRIQEKHIQSFLVHLHSAIPSLGSARDWNI